MTTNNIIFSMFHFMCITTCFADGAIDLLNRFNSVDNHNQSVIIRQHISNMPQLKGGAVEMYLNILALQQKYYNARAREQSLENRTLTALTVAATGIGGMELAQGLAEQKADKDAEQDMDAYTATFRCEYGNGKSVKGGTTEIELPGGNAPEMMKLRNEYFTLATSLKERKEALGMKPGIESEVVLDKSQMGLYTQENTGITSGAYGSLYRAAMGNETDQTKLQEMKDTSSKRVKGGGIAVGTGMVGGIVGNQLINGKTDNK